MVAVRAARRDLPTDWVAGNSLGLRPMWDSLQRSAPVLQLRSLVTLNPSTVAMYTCLSALVGVCFAVPFFYWLKRRKTRQIQDSNERGTRAMTERDNLQNTLEQERNLHQAKVEEERTAHRAAVEKLGGAVRELGEKVEELERTYKAKLDQEKTIHQSTVMELENNLKAQLDLFSSRLRETGDERDEARTAMEAATRKAAVLSDLCDDLNDQLRQKTAEMTLRLNNLNDEIQQKTTEITSLSVYVEQLQERLRFQTNATRSMIGPLEEEIQTLKEAARVKGQNARNQLSRGLEEVSHAARESEAFMNWLGEFGNITSPFSDGTYA